MLEKIYNKFRNVFRVLFAPYSPIITLVIGWLLTLLVTTVPHENDFPRIVNWLLVNKLTVCWFIIAWLVISIFYTIQEQEIEAKNKKISELKGAIREKESQMNQTAGIILNKYGEFAKFNKLNRFAEALKSFVENNEEIDSAQIYKYSYKFTKNDIKIRAFYEQGYAYEEVEINNILQIYYSLDKKDYKSFQDIVLCWKKYLVNGNQYTKDERECLEQSLLNKIKDLLEKLYNSLKDKKRKKQISSRDFDNYRMLTLLVRMLNDNNVITETESILPKRGIETYLNTGKRTGILGSILLQDSFIFKHTGKNSKYGRLYVCFHIEIYYENYIVLFSIPPSELDENEDWQIELDRLKDDFISRLNRTGN